VIKTYEGIVIRQTKIIGGRRMVLIFTRDEGKVSAGTHISEKSKGVAALAIRPFAYGQYTMTEKREGLRQLSAADIINAHFALGSDADRFSEASFILEFTDKILPEGAPEPEIFDLLKDYLGMIVVRKTDFRLLTISYMLKVMQELGVFPDAASLSGSELLSNLNGDILNALVFIEGQTLKRMEKLTLDIEKERAIFAALKAFAQKNLDLGAIKSECMFTKSSQ